MVSINRDDLLGKKRKKLILIDYIFTTPFTEVEVLET